MRKILLCTLILMALAAYTSKVDTANPASIHCEQNGYELEIRTAEDGSQSGFCVFPDDSSCEEWAYYRGECGPSEQISPTLATTQIATPDAIGGGPGGDDPGSFMPQVATEDISDWWGVIKGTEPGAQYDDCFERRDLGQIIYFGIDSKDPAVQAQISRVAGRGTVRVSSRSPSTRHRGSTWGGATYTQKRPCTPGCSVHRHSRTGG